MSCAVRLTRAEKREQTRSQLLDAASRVFAEHGLDGATVDDVAAAAGFTKGAVYSHFGSKDELFLAMLEARYDARMTELERLLASPGKHDDQAVVAARDFEAYVRADPGWQRLYLEGLLKASRDPVFRSAFARRHNEMHDRLAEALAARLARDGLASPIDPGRLATLISALASGVQLESFVARQGDADDLFGTAIGLLAAVVGPGS